MIGRPAFDVYAQGRLPTRARHGFGAVYYPGAAARPPIQITRSRYGLPPETRVARSTGEAGIIIRGWMRERAGDAIVAMRSDWRRRGSYCGWAWSQFTGWRVNGDCPYELRSLIGGRRFHGRLLHALGQAPERPLPPYLVGAEAAGRSYLRVTPDMQVAVGTSLSNFDLRDRSSDQRDKAFVLDRFDGMRKVPATNLGHVVAELRDGRGIAIVGDPLKDTLVRVYLGRSLDQLAAAEPEGGWYVLSDPDGGWEGGWTGEGLAVKAERAGARLMWGTIVGGALALGAIVVLARKGKR
jgi:hypothetical protein